MKKKKIKVKDLKPLDQDTNSLHFESKINNLKPSEVGVQFRKQEELPKSLDFLEDCKIIDDDDFFEALEKILNLEKDDFKILNLSKQFDEIDSKIGNILVGHTINEIKIELIKALFFNYKENAND